MSETNPKLFISYCWTSVEHIEWVIRLAEKLVGNGVDVELDKWSLKEGQDIPSYIERMVTDETINRVVIISDEEYSKKANDRTGGVGRETYVISEELYKKKDQTKFVVVLKEKNASGEACLPAYCASRLYIDFSDVQKQEQNYEQLLRWIYDKPMYVKPEVGLPYEFRESSLESLASVNHPSIIRDIQNQFDNSIKLGNNNYLTNLRDLFSFIERYLVEIRVNKDDDDVMLHQIKERIENSAFIVKNYVVILDKLILTPKFDTLFRSFHRFFENLIKYMDIPEGENSINQLSLDIYRYIIHEMFLFTIAKLIYNRKYKFAKSLMNTPYYYPNGKLIMNGPKFNFSVFYDYMRFYGALNGVDELTAVRLRSKYLSERSVDLFDSFDIVKQADLVLFIRDKIAGDAENHSRWFPETLLYAIRQTYPFEIFGRIDSVEEINEVLDLLGATDFDIFRSCISEMTGQNAIRFYRAVPPSPDISRLVSLDELSNIEM